MIALDRAPLLLALTLCACSRAEQTEGRAVDIFTSEVLPVLEKHCYECHGPEEERVKAACVSRGAIPS